MDEFRLSQQPRDWKKLPFGECCPVVTDSCDPSEADGRAYLGLEHLASGFPSLVGTGTPDDVMSAKTAFRTRDILYGKLRPYLRKAVLAPFDGICSTDIIVVRAKECALPEFITFLVHSEQFVNRAKATTSGVNHPRTSWSKLSPFIVPVPPISEQRRIAAVLTAVQRAVQQQERLIALTVELKKALMHKLFTEGTRGEQQKESEAGRIPRSWTIARLGDCCAVQTGIAKGRMVPAAQAITLPYLRVANVQDGYLDLSEMKEITIRRTEVDRFSLRVGDLVLTEGGDLDKLGRGFIWHGQIERCVHQNHVFVVRPDPARISVEFLAYQVQSPYGKAYFLSVAHKTTNLACINTTKLKGLPVLVPNADEQESIVTVLQQIDDKLRAHRSRRELLNDLFRTLLHQLMTAQLRVDKVDLSQLEALGIEVE